MSIQHAHVQVQSENFNEIVNLSCEELDDEINQEELNGLEDDINNYFSLYVPDDEEFREFIKILSMYLTFIAKKSLYPPGIKFSNETTDIKREISFIVLGKAHS